MIRSRALESAGRERCEVATTALDRTPVDLSVQWTRDVQAWHPDVVFLQLFGNDVREDHTTSRIPRAMNGDFRPPFTVLAAAGCSRNCDSCTSRGRDTMYARWQWQREHQGQAQWTVGGVVEENPDFLGETPKLVQELDRRVRAAGSRLVVMSVPSRYRLMADGKIKVDGDFHQTVKQFTTADGIEFLDLREPFERAGKAGVQLFWQQDIHYNEAGNRVVAAAIARHYPEYFSKGAEIDGPVVAAAFPESSDR